MLVSNLEGLRHPPEVVVNFVKRLIAGYRPPVASEQRTQPREAIAIPVVVQPLDADFQATGNNFDAVTKDISTGGIGLIHSGQVAAKYLQIEIAGHDGEKMSLLAQVKHCTPAAQHYHIGARFVVDWSLWREDESGSNSSSGARRR